MKYNAFENNSSLDRLDLTNPYEVNEQVEILQDIIENTPPYKICEWSIDYYSDLGEIKSLAVDDYCECCKDIKVFTNINPLIFDETLIDDIGKYRPIYSGIDGVDIPLPNPKDEYKTKKYVVSVILKCAKCGEEHFYSIVFLGDKVVKIGQYPSFAGREKHELEKYKNIISKYYIELIRSVNAYSQHMGIAAFVYLRRIYEHIIETEYSKLPQEAQNSKAKFDEKMKAVEKEMRIIPPELDSQKSKIYSILSKGIHEYEEDECYELYPMMKAIIILMLEKYLSEKERKKQLREIEKTLKSK